MLPSRGVPAVRTCCRHHPHRPGALPLTGPLGAVVKPIAEGQKALLDAVNAQGGINGASIDLLTLDDATQPDKHRGTTPAPLLDDPSLAGPLRRATPSCRGW